MAQEFGLRPGQLHGTESQIEKRYSLSPLCPRRQYDSSLFNNGHGFAGRIQAGSIGQLAVVHATSNDMELLCRGTGIESEDVALAVAQHGHHGSFGQQRLGRQGRCDPALRFLVREIALIVRDGAATLAGPNLAVQQAKAAAALGVGCQHRVQQYPTAIAVTDLSEPPPAFGSRSKIDFAGILDRQHMAAFNCGYRALAPALDQAPGRHPDIAKKAVELHFPGADAFGQPPQANILARDHAFDERRPPLSRRRSPNRPNDQSICANIRHLRQSRSAAI